MAAETENEPYNAGDPEAVGKAKKKAKLREQLSKNLVRTVMSNPDGRAWIWDLLSSTGLFRNPHRTTATETSFACGMMNAGQLVLAQIMAECPELYVMMQKEQSDG